MDSVRSSVDDFNAKLFNISNNLGEQEVSLLVFLCKDYIPDASKIKDCLDLFMKLQERSLMGKNDTFILQELLYYIGRYDLLHDYLDTGKSQVEEKIKDPGRTHISPFRRLLLELSQNVLENELKNIKDLVKNDINPSKMEKVTCMQDIFIELEKTQVMHKDKVDKLIEIFTEINGNLLEKVINYEKNRTGDLQTGLNSELSASLHKNLSLSDEPSKSNSSCHQQMYEMSKNPHGKCVIISNYNFETAKSKNDTLEKPKNRRGTEIDEESLKRVFSKLDFKVILHKDLTGDAILQTIREYGAQTHEDSDCFICCILSHGDRGVIHGTDGESVAIWNLTSCFKKSNCPSLAGKPKIFFIQACQGKAHQVPVQVDADACNASLKCDVTKNDLIPNEPDFLLGMATTQDHVSLRHRTQGSWYIQSLCNQIEKSINSEEDIQSILTRVNNEVSQKPGQQMPEPYTTLCKQLRFFIPSRST